MVLPPAPADFRLRSIKTETYRSARPNTSLPDVNLALDRPSRINFVVAIGGTPAYSKSTPAVVTARE